MNLGELFDHSGDALRAVVVEMGNGGGPGGIVDMLTVVTARSAVYTGLARCVLVLSGDAVTVDPELFDHGPARAFASSLLAVRGQHANKLYAGLRAAAAGGGYPPAAVAMSPAAGSMLRAADLIGAAADLLAGHAPAGRPPRTAEGAAIRAGGAAREGLAVIAGLTHRAVRVDARLGVWLASGPATGGGSYADRYAAALLPARWTVASGLDEVARQLMRGATGHPDLRLLAPAYPAVFDVAPVSSDMVGRFLAVRDWLWRHPGDIDSRHHRAATQLGLGVTVLAADRRRARWRGAAAAAVQLCGAAVDGPAAVVAAELADLTVTVRDLLHAEQPNPVRVAAMAGLGPALPDLALALREGLAVGVARRAVLIAEAGLAAQPTGLVYRYQSRVRPATDRDPTIVELGRRLATCAAPATAPVDRLPAARTPGAALAFPAPPRPATATPSAAVPTPNRLLPPRQRHR